VTISKYVMIFIVLATCPCACHLLMLNSHCLNLSDQGVLLQQMMINKAILLFRKYISDSDI